jgi:hypothetical protein
VTVSINLKEEADYQEKFRGRLKRK